MPLTKVQAAFVGSAMFSANIVYNSEGFSEFSIALLVRNSRGNWAEFSGSRYAYLALERLSLRSL